MPIVIARVAESGSLNPRQVKIPGILVDYVIAANPENHWQILGTQYNPAYSSGDQGAHRLIAANADELTQDHCTPRGV